MQDYRPVLFGEGLVFMELSEVRSPEELERLVLRIGFLPFFRNEIQGFSIEEVTPRELWFNNEIDGPWEWKGPVICGGLCTYGKFFNRKAGYVSLEWFPDFANWRRSNSSLTKDEGLLLNAVNEHESLLTNELKDLCGYVRPHPARSCLDKMAERKVKRMSERKSYDAAITNLQMTTFCVIADFEYKTDHNGNPYGWGVARYTTPEFLYDRKALKVDRSPQESRERMLEHLGQLFPQITEDQLSRLI